MNRGEMSPSHAELKIGELARLTGKTVRALHFYEEQGILHPVSRTEGGFRKYNMESVYRVGLIEKLKSLGMKLPAIGELLAKFENSDTGSEAARTFRAELVAKRRALDEEIKRLTELRGELADTVEYLSYCVHSCARDTGPEKCTSCGYAANEEGRPDIISGLYT